VKKIPVKFLVLAALAIGGIVLSQWGPAAQYFHADRLREGVEACRASGWGVVVFLSIYVAGSMLALPSVGFSLLGGVVFGFWPGVLYNLIGCNLGALAAFAVARSLGRETVRSWVRSDKLSQFENAIERHGYPVIVAFRILPLLPFNVVNFGSALLRIRFRDYLAGTLVGTFPATVLFTYYATVPGGGRNWKLETAVLVIAVTAIAGSWWVMHRTFKGSAQGGPGPKA
jgi:uncharacterized membrane protein YdjX (TVP38/TMEM64 family)